MKILLSVAGIVAALFLSGGAQAQTRYVERPPVLVSPDLSAPWVQQLRRPPSGAQQRRYQPQTVSQSNFKPEPWRAIPRQIERRPIFGRQRQQVHTRVQPPARVRVPAQIRRPAHTRQPVQVRPPARARVQPPVRARPSQLHTAAVAPRAPAAPKQSMDPTFLPTTVDYEGPHKAGTLIVDTGQRFLFLVLPGGKAKRYGVGVGKEGFEWKGTENISRKREWPDWRPPASMIARERKKGNILPVHMEGGPQNPLGARALYLGSTLYRIHGTNAPSTIGRAVSSGCIRMRNEDVIDLYERVPVGSKVVVL